MFAAVTEMCLPERSWFFVQNLAEHSQIQCQWQFRTASESEIDVPQPKPMPMKVGKLDIWQVNF